MRALLVPAYDGPTATVVTDVPEPEGAHPWAAGERLLVEVRAAAVAFPDVLQSRGRYQHGSELPFVSGGEFAGEVVEAPVGSRFAPGDRVAGMSVWGAVAERVLAIPRYTLKIPEHVSWAQGAAYFLNYSTAWFTLHRGRFRDGDSVLVTGAAGGVGTATLDLLRGRAGTAIALVSSPVKAEVASSSGADHVVLTSSSWRQQVLDLTGGRGVDMVADIVGGEGFVDALRSLDVGGRLMVVGFTGGIPTVAANRLLLRDLSVIGVSLEPWEQRFPGIVADCVDALERLAAENAVDPHVGHVLPLDRAPEALGIIERREALGKVVVVLQ